MSLVSSASSSSHLTSCLRVVLQPVGHPTAYPQCKDISSIQRALCKAERQSDPEVVKLLNTLLKEEILL